MASWVIGRGGLLGFEIDTLVPVPFDPGSLPWGEADLLGPALTQAYREFRGTCTGEPWAIYWAAGSAVVASTPDRMQAELSALRTIVELVASEPPTGSGAFFLASSAGGVYAGSAGPPFDADTTPVPISPYGQLKLDQEDLARAALDGAVPLVIGRIANLYGARQNRGKSQGLVYNLCYSVVRRRPINLYVPMETLRDYVAADDVARTIVRLTEEARAGGTPSARVHVIASGTATTVASLIGIVNDVTHRKVPIALGQDGSARHQAIDLRLAPSPDVLRAMHPVTPLPVGVRRLHDAMVSQP